MSKYRGHNIKLIDNEFVYSDTGKKVCDNKNIKCKFCKKENTEEGHDGCLGTLPGLMNACCGHGTIGEAYVQFLDGKCIKGQDAILIQNILKKYN